MLNISIENKDDKVSEKKRRILVNRMLQPDSRVDLIPKEVLEHPKIVQVLRGLTRTQATFFTVHLRNVPDGIALCEGPWGSGKTKLITVLLQCMVLQDKRMLVSCAQNSACENMIAKLQRLGGDHVCVRLHAMGQFTIFSYQ